MTVAAHSDPSSAPDLTVLLARWGQRWSVQIGEPFAAAAGLWVGRVRSADGQPLVLKLSTTGPGEGADEDRDAALGLRAWDGNGAVRLIHSHVEDGVRGLLLEECGPGAVLAQSLPPLAQDAVIAGLLRKLWIQPPAELSFRPLLELCDARASAFEAATQSPGRHARPAEPAQLDPVLVAEGLALIRQLPRSAYRTVLLGTDVRAANVLSSRREPWLLIDPKPYVGDPTFDATQHLLSVPERLAADPHGLVVRMADLLDLDRRRLLDWLFARCVLASAEQPRLAEVATALARR